jgi:gliding motility-associated-like protein
LNEISPNGVRGTWAPAIIDPVIEGSYIFSPNEGECATSQTITTSINQPTLTAIDYTVTEAFSDDAIITVMATSAGNYLYQLDGGELQQSNIFTNVAEGTHTVMVIDVNGCSDPLVQENIKVIKFPHYFTPNADGYHDAWKINGLSNDAIIMIFDRYGKLLKQIQSDGPGWDGTYNNAQMPSSDYWFTVQYNNQSQAKRFLAHFTLKR